MPTLSRDTPAGLIVANQRPPGSAASCPRGSGNTDVPLLNAEVRQMDGTRGGYGDAVLLRGEGGSHLWLPWSGLVGRRALIAAPYQ